MKKGSKVRVPKGRSQLDEYAMTDSDNEQDGFAAGSDRVGLEKGAGADSDDEIDEEAVYDLDDEDEDDDSEEDDDEIDDEDALEQALQQGGKAAQLAKQAKYLAEKLKIQQGDASESDEEDQQEPGVKDKLWGANKRTYYQEGEEEASDEEAMREEEEEVKRLQAQQAAMLTDDDFGLPGASQQQQQGEPTLGDLASADPSSPPTDGAGKFEVETVAKDLSALTSEEQLAVVMADAPELLSLLDELKVCLAEVRSKIAPLLREVSAGQLATAAGLSYLEAKHLLLLQYCMCIVAYLMLKAEGRSVKGHPVVERLLQLRAYIEKIRPIDKQLAYQIDKLLRATSKTQNMAATEAADAEDETAAAAAGDDDALRYRPNPQALITKAPLVGDTTGLDGAASGGVYRPPKLNPVAMEEDRALSNKDRRRLLEAQRRAQRSSVMREMAAELAGAPEEVRYEVPGFDSAAAVAARQRLEARSAQEEELMLRVPLSKQEAKKLKAQRRAGLSGAGLTDFADDVADLVNATSGDKPGGSLAALYGKKQLSQQYGADLATQQNKMRSGDEDLMPRKPLHERRAAFDAVAARRAAAAGSDDDFADGGQRKRQRSASEEDELYASTKAAKAAAKAEKKRKHEVPQLAPPLPEPEAVGQRKISYEIEKNRGLTPHRRKDLKNPRKKHRVKFAQAVVRRKGQVQSVQAAPSAPRGYAGEATGIKAKVAKSVRLG